jgi:hypothetical protein
MRRWLAAPVGALGYELVKRHFYSPIPDIENLATEIFTRKSALAGVGFDPAGGLTFLKRELAPYIPEYQPPLRETGDPRRFYLGNTLYSGVDAETLYAMVRRFAPRRVLELGSGMSTLVIADARERNGQTDRMDHVVCDPYPRPELAEVLAAIADLRAVSATDLPQTEFAKLQEGDLLFVDTTHTVKVGGEVNRLILEILPTIARGVLIHVHDIYLPWEYPREFITERRFFWAEQYLLQAFLAFNEQFEVLFGTHALARGYPDEISELVPNSCCATLPSAFWIRRTG